jgi:hypothetical protein
MDPSLWRLLVHKYPIYKKKKKTKSDMDMSTPLPVHDDNTQLDNLFQGVSTRQGGAVRMDAYTFTTT